MSLQTLRDVQNIEDSACADLLRFSVVSQGASPRFHCGFTQASSHGPRTDPNLRGVRPWLPLAALGRRMGVPEVVFISDFSHYLFTNLCRLPGGGLPLLGQMMICSSRSCLSLFCVATREHEPRSP